jgi:hypothetical protein
VEIQSSPLATKYAAHIVDSIAYTRTGEDTVIGIGTKNETVVLRETLTISAHDDSLSLIYSIYAGTRKIANGTAIFEAHVDA